VGPGERARLNGRLNPAKKDYLNPEEGHATKGIDPKNMTRNSGRKGLWASKGKEALSAPVGEKKFYPPGEARGRVSTQRCFLEDKR